MQSTFWLKMWCVPLMDAALSKELIAGTRRLAEVAAIRELKAMSPSSEYWLLLLGGDFYRFGVGTNWLGLISIEDVGYAPDKKQPLSEDEDGNG